MRCEIFGFLIQLKPLKFARLIILESNYGMIWLGHNIQSQKQTSRQPIYILGIKLRDICVPIGVRGRISLGVLSRFTALQSFLSIISCGLSSSSDSVARSYCPRQFLSSQRISHSFFSAAVNKKELGALIALLECVLR